MASDFPLGGACASSRISVAEVARLGPPRTAAERLGVNFPDRLAGAVRSRQYEFIAGRAAAQAALHVAGFGGHALLTASAHRAPQWPGGFVGSIAHSHGKAWAVAAPRQHFDGLGIDLEHCLGQVPAEELAPALMRAEEIASARRSPLGFGVHVTLVFSAKESLYKCLNPLFGKEFGFHDLVAETLETAAGTLGLRLEAPLAPRVEAGRHFEVEYRIERGAVWTAVGLRNG
jgi:enterobactin synthetase component D